jgi:hypothetical protein
MTDKSNTYFDRAQNDPDAPGGRYAKPSIPVVGAGPLPLAVPAWSRDLAAMPLEPPLGADVNAVPDLCMPEGRRAQPTWRRY